MMIPVDQAKTQLDSLIDRSNAGEEVVITRGGLPVARMVAVSPGDHPGTPSGNGTGHEANGTDGQSGSLPPRQLGWAKGIVIGPDFDEPLEEFREYTG